MTTVLTLCGSLRAGSSNATLLEAASLVAPDGVTLVAFDGLADIPAFNPDVEQSDAPPHQAVAGWRRSLATADALLISSPEYAHGIPGVLKNALDWVVGSGELVFKPVGLLNASASSQFAHPQLVEVLTVMNANVVAEATRLIDMPRRAANARDLIDDPIIAQALGEVVRALVNAVAVVRQ